MDLDLQIIRISPHSRLNYKKSKAIFTKLDFTDIQNRIASLTRQTHAPIKLQAKGAWVLLFIEKYDLNKHIHVFHQKLQEIQAADIIDSSTFHTRRLLKLLDKTDTMLDFDPAI